MKDLEDPAILKRILGFGRLFDTIQDAVIVAEVKSERIVLWNPAAARMFGYTSEEAVGLALETIVPPELRDKHKAGLARYRSTGDGAIVNSQTPVEIPAVAKDGAKFHVELTLTPIADAEIPGSYVFALIRDVTERKRLERFKEDFIAHAAHELRTPIQAIIGFSGLLTRWEKLSSDQIQGSVSALNRQGERLGSLIRSLLDLSRLQRGHVSIDLQEVRVGIVAREVIELNPVPADKVVTVLVSDETTATADPSRLHQIITNLLTNAYRYGGTNITLAVDSKVDRVELTVADDGPGVPDNLVRELFEPFVGGRSSQQAGGHGLGLAITKALATAMGGDVRYEHNRPHGARFVLSIKRAQI